ncbi:Glutathione S-transferase [Macleaya cordata]|uniref:Glutathione S-transferase n=1 Tax=Macleaya cordata TaxID=56857 RepID=A0A200QAC0_MACCD|nr:Glutathione S-transferase [Macleaya cordata]
MVDANHFRMDANHDDIRYWEEGVDEQRKRATESKSRVDRVPEIVGSRVGWETLFWGENLGFVDVALVPFYAWCYTYETFGKFSVERDCPKLMAWAKWSVENNESVSKSLPDPQKVYKYVLVPRKKFRVD